MLQLNNKPTKRPLRADIIHGHVPLPDLQTHAQNFSRWKNETACERQVLSLADNIPHQEYVTMLSSTLKCTDVGITGFLPTRYGSSPDGELF